MRFSTTLSFAVVAAALGLSACSGEKQAAETNTTPAAGVVSASEPAAQEPMLQDTASGTASEAAQ
ncbi:MAG: hypothetical protein Q4G28_06740 [Neisseria sp.]|nr:hypothetical protein [Neisseria sp.]